MRVMASLLHLSVCRGIYVGSTASLRRLDHVRSFTLASQRLARSRKPADEDEDEEVNNEPIKFSTSKGSHKTWQVERSLGVQYQRPWWKVLPLSLVCVGFLLWCVLRPDSDVDEQLEKHLYEHLPGLLSDDEEEEEQPTSKPS